MKKLGFKEVKRRVILALEKGTYIHEARASIDEKNLLQSGDVSADDVLDIIKRCMGQHHTSGKHHFLECEVHVLKRDGWYIKFHFDQDPDTVFISVHQ